MTPQQLKLIRIYRPLLETLDECEGGQLIESHAWIAYNGILNMDQFFSMLNGLVTQKVITVKNHVISKGKNFELYVATFSKVWRALDNAKSEAV